jgi:hypothetical protein
MEFVGCMKPFSHSWKMLGRCSEDVPIVGAKEAFEEDPALAMDEVHQHGVTKKCSKVAIKHWSISGKYFVTNSELTCGCSTVPAVSILQVFMQQRVKDGSLEPSGKPVSARHAENIPGQWVRCFLHWRPPWNHANTPIPANPIII